MVQRSPTNSQGPQMKALAPTAIFTVTRAPPSLPDEHRDEQRSGSATCWKLQAVSWTPNQMCPARSSKPFPYTRCGTLSQSIIPLLQPKAVAVCSRAGFSPQIPLGNLLGTDHKREKRIWRRNPPMPGYLCPAKGRTAGHNLHSSSPVS